MIFNIPMILTFFRIAIVPFFVLAFYLQGTNYSYVCTSIFVIAAITDWVDGFLARHWKQTTKFGAFLDPVADKILVTITLVLVTEYYSIWWITVPAIIMIMREIVISALREWMAEIGKRSSVAVSSLGKLKTTAQMVALILLLWHPNRWLEGVGFVALYVAAVLTFWSMFQYLRAAREDLLNAN